MKRKQTPKLNTSQRTVQYYSEMRAAVDPDLQRRRRYSGLLQSHMLIEDIYTQIVPIGGRSRKKSFKIELVPPSETVESLVASALKPREHGWRNELSSSVADFFVECAQSLVTFGEAVYEIVFLSNPEDKKVLEFEFQHVRPLSVKRRRGYFVQLVPREVVEQRGISNFIDLPADRILIFKLPAQLQRSLASTLESLAVLSEKLVPDFALKNLAEAASKFRYDSANQVSSKKLALAAAGRSIGWNARGLFNDEMLEFYQLKRQLSFERFKIMLRTSILETLNRGLSLAGKEMGFEAQITIQGLASMSDIEVAESELDAGSKPFQEIFGRFLYY